MAISRPSTRWLLLLALSLLLISCSLGQGPIDPSDYRFEEPVPFYLYLPDGYSQNERWPLFVGVHGSSTDGRACWNTWQPYADDEGFVLLCPELADPDGILHQLHGADRLNLILNRIYQEYSLQSAIFITGFSAGGQFVHGYAFQYPQYVAAASVMAPGDYYLPPPSARSIPFAISIGAWENPAIVQALAAALQQNGNSVQLHIIPGVGHSVSTEAIRLTLDLFEAELP